MSYQIRVTNGVISEVLLSAMGEQERLDATEVSARKDTMTITVLDAKGAAVAYAIFGHDDGDMIAVYLARSFIPVFGPMMMKQFFGVADVLGKPLRMHVANLRDIQVKARMFGANVAFEGVDADGIMQGVFSNVE